MSGLIHVLKIQYCYVQVSGFIHVLRSGPVVERVNGMLAFCLMERCNEKLEELFDFFPTHESAELELQDYFPCSMLAELRFHSITCSILAPESGQLRALGHALS